MPASFPLDPIERASEQVHREFAARLRRDPRVASEAAELVRRWIALEPHPHPVLLEWKAVLEMLTPAELADFLESPLPRARRLRGSSPFLALARESS